MTNFNEIAQIVNTLGDEVDELCNVINNIMLIHREGIDHLCIECRHEFPCMTIDAIRMLVFNKVPDA